jgi:ribose transport system substrate-binding protein
MNLTKKLLLVSLILVLATGAVFAGGGKSASGKKTIVMLPPAMTSTFYQSTIAGAKDAAAQLGYEFNTMAPQQESDYAGQVQMMEDLITQKVAAIMVCAINIDAIGTGVKKANAAGIPVIFFNTITDLSGGGDVYALSGYNQYKGGANLADWLAKKTGGKAKVALILGLPSDYTTQRRNGFIDQCKAKYPGITVVAEAPGDWVRDKGMNAALDMLQAHPDITAIYGLSDAMALGAYQAKKQVNRNDVLILGLDGTPEALESVKKGELDCTLFCDPYTIGKNAAIYADKALKGEKLSEKVVETPTTVADKTNVDQFL